MMDIKAFPIDGKLYDSSPFSTWFATRTNGVYSSETNFKTSFKQDMQVEVSSGIGWLHLTDFSGMVVWEELAKTFTIDIGDATLNRIDAIVIGYDGVNKTSYMEVKKGVPATNPVPPATSRSAANFELTLAYISVPKGTITLNAGLITDKRLDPSVCGIMSDGVTRIPTEQLNAQFDAWMVLVKKAYQDAIGGTLAGNLQTQINEKAPKANPTFTGTVSGITKSMVGLGNVNNETTINNLDSTSATAPLSANMGKKLQDEKLAKTSMTFINGTLTITNN